MHEYITSAQSVERWIFLRIRSSTSTLFRDATYIWERRTSLCIRHDITPAPAFPPRSFLSRNFKCLLHLIIRHYARSQTPRTSSSSREIYRQLGHDVSGRLSSNRPILKTNWLNAVWKAPREIHQEFPFFFKFYIGKFYIFMFSWKDRSVKRETNVSCSLILWWFSKWSFHVEWLNAFNNLYRMMEFMSHLRNIPRRYLPMSLGKWDWFMNITLFLDF